jgi:hypothetical protein
MFMGILKFGVGDVLNLDHTGFDINHTSVLTH